MCQSSVSAPTQSDKVGNQVLDLLRGEARPTKVVVIRVAPLVGSVIRGHPCRWFAYLGCHQPKPHLAGIEALRHISKRRPVLRHTGVRRVAMAIHAARSVRICVERPAPIGLASPAGEAGLYPGGIGDAVLHRSVRPLLGVRCPSGERYSGDAQECGEHRLEAPPGPRYLLDMTDDTDTQELDATGLLCPLPVLKIRKRLSALAPGARLRVYADDPAARVDVPHFCAEQRHDLLSTDDLPDGRLLFVIAKGT